MNDVSNLVECFCRESVQSGLTLRPASSCLIHSSAVPAAPTAKRCKGDTKEGTTQAFTGGSLS